MPFKYGNIEFYMGPQELGAPDNLEDIIINYITKAEKRLDVAVQELDNWNIANALIKARQNKRTVTVVLEGDYLKSSPGLANPYQEGGSLRFNREIMAALLRANVNLKIDYNPYIFHQKFIVRDRESLLTGSTNFTDTGTHKNLNHIFIVHNKEVAMHYYREFKEIMVGKFGKYSIAHGPRPETVAVSGVPVKVLFAPDHNPEMEIMKQMSKAEKRIDFAIFTFSQSSGIDDAIIVLEKANIPVRGVFDYMQGNAEWAATRMIQEAGAEAYLAKKDQHGNEFQRHLGKLHHKLMVIDEQVVIGGSFNYTAPANLLNDENIFVIGSPYIENKKAIKAQKKLAQYALSEINRIIDTFGVVPSIQ